MARAPAQPAPITMPMRGDLVLRLDDGVGLLAGLLVHAQLLGVVAERVHQAGGRRDRIPGGDGDAAEDSAHRAGLVAGDENLAGRLVRASARGRGRA